MRNEIIRLTEEVIAEFIEYFQCNPFLMYKEIDFQVELVSRLNKALEIKNLDTIEANYQLYKSIRERQIWKRVCCEAKIWIDDQIKEYVYPDIIIWDNLSDINDPPDKFNVRNFPVILIIEIKINEQPNLNKKCEVDLEKLGRLISNKVIEKGYLISFSRTKKEKALECLDQNNFQIRNIKVHIPIEAKK